MNKRYTKRAISFLLVLALTVSVCMAGALAADERTNFEQYILVDETEKYVVFNVSELQEQIIAGEGALLELFDRLMALSDNPVSYVFNDGVAVSRSALQGAFALGWNELEDKTDADAIAALVADVYAEAAAHAELEGEKIYSVNADGTVSEEAAFIVTDGALEEIEPDEDEFEAVKEAFGAIADYITEEFPKGEIVITADNIDDATALLEAAEAAMQTMLDDGYVGDFETLDDYDAYAALRAAVDAYELAEAITEVAGMAAGLEAKLADALDETNTEYTLEDYAEDVKEVQAALTALGLTEDAIAELPEELQTALTEAGEALEIANEVVAVDAAVKEVKAIQTQIEALDPANTAERAELLEKLAKAVAEAEIAVVRLTSIAGEDTVLVGFATDSNGSVANTVNDIESLYPGEFVPVTVEDILIGRINHYNNVKQAIVTDKPASEVETGRWVMTQDAFAKFVSAIADAQALLDSGTATDEEMIAAIKAMDGAYAKGTNGTYVAPSWKVTFDANNENATGSRGDMNGVEGVDVISVMPGAGSMKLEGYKITGWSETADGEPIEYPFAPVGEIALYAIWEVDEGGDDDDDAEFAILVMQNEGVFLRVALRITSDYEIRGATLLNSTQNAATPGKDVTLVFFLALSNFGPGELESILATPDSKRAFVEENITYDIGKPTFDQDIVITPPTAVELMTFVRCAVVLNPAKNTVGARVYANDVELVQDSNGVYRNNEGFPSGTTEITIRVDLTDGTYWEDTIPVTKPTA